MPEHTSALLLTKLNRPPVIGDRLERPRLIEMLNRGLSGPLSLVSAAAGFGKTTLVSAWIEELAANERSPIPSAWLSLDENDGDLVVFLRYLVAAIRTIFPESCVEMLFRLQMVQPSSPAQLLVALSNELERLPMRFILVLDDYHAVRGEAVHDFLSELIRHWPQSLHLVMITRTNPPLPLANLRAKGQVVEIRSHDLRFTSEESAAFLNKSLAAPLSPAALALLDQNIEGWVVGLRLVALTLSGGADAETALAGLSSVDAGIVDFLVDEVLSYQPPAILKFLLVTSVLDRFCVALCECVLDVVASSDDLQCDVQACIQWLDRADLFVIPLNNDREWRRYHHLFQELLQRRLLAQVGAVRVAEIHHTAAAWFAGQGLFEEALRHALAAKDLDLAERLMVEGLCDVLDQDARSTLDRWLRMLPEEYIQRSPWLLMMTALVFQFSWNLRAVSTLLTQIEALLDEGDAAVSHAGEPHDLQALRGLIATLRGQQAFSNCEAASAIAYCAEALALLPERWTWGRGGALLYWGMSMRASGRGDAAYRRLIDEYESLLWKTDAYAVRLLFAAGFNALESGDLANAGQLGRLMLEQAPAGQAVILQGWAHYFLGVVHYCWNELDAATLHFAELANNHYAFHRQAARNGMIGLARVYLAREEHSEAWQVMELLSQFDLERTGQEGDDARSLRAQLAYWQGDTENALRWATDYAGPAPDRLLTWLQDPHMAKARLLLASGAEGDVQSALDLSATLNELAQRSFSIRFQIEILALRAVAFEEQGKAVDAMAALQEAVELAQPGGFIRVFVDLGPHMQTLLLRLAAQGVATETVRRILAAFPVAQNNRTAGDTEFGNRAANTKLLEPLTNRELQVLSLLLERLSDKEIAHRLSISTVTVKRHTINIYGKLGVHKRWDAVVKAKALGILPRADFVVPPG